MIPNVSTDLGAPSANPSAKGGRRWLAPLALAALMGGLLFARLGDDLPLRSHEALLAETARNMYMGRPVQLADGSRPSPWLVPNFNDVPRLRKTPLPYWTVAGLACLTGAVDEWTARLPSALAALGTALITLALVRRWDGRLASLAAAATLVTSAEFLIAARSALSDMPMTFFCTASLAAVWMAVETRGARRFAWLLATGAAAALAMLAKGPVPAIVLPLPLAVAAVIMLVRLVRPKDPLKARGAEWAWTLGGVAAGTLVFFAIAMPWPVYVWLKVPQAIDIWRAESVDRSTGDFGHQEPIYFYVIRLPLLLAPWTVFFIHGLVVAARRVRREPAARAWLLFLGAWFVGTLAAISAAAGKQDHYLLPLVPACAAYIALSLRHFLQPSSPRAERAGIRVMQAHGFALIVLCVAGFLALVHLSMQLGLLPPTPHISQDFAAFFFKKGLHVPAAYILIICLVGGIATAVLAVPQGLHRSLAALVATFAAVFLLAMSTMIGPVDRAAVAADFGRKIRTVVPADAPLFSYVGSNNTVIFYAGRPIPILVGPDSVRQELARGRPFYLIDHGKHEGLPPQAEGFTLVLREEDPIRPDEGFRLLKSAAPAKAPQ
ncbi:MAG: glycosyltransferase family 39 protein [Planctomycetota bacterium]|nr:glycosyltransferase family 39 protein [Planctomycetota bacterium]